MFDYYLIYLFIGFFIGSFLLIGYYKAGEDITLFSIKCLLVFSVGWIIIPFMFLGSNEIVLIKGKNNDDS